MKKINSLYFFYFITLLLVFLFYIPTIFYELKLYDELIPIKEIFLPVCKSLTDLFDIILYLGLNQHYQSTNSYYSNISSIRCNPFGTFLQLIIQFLFQKNSTYYHMYSVILHLINASFLFFIIFRINDFLFKIKNDFSAYITASLLTILWALHPVNLESVLLLSNANIVLSYTFVFTSIFIFFTNLANKNKITRASVFFIFIFYLLGLFTAEFHFFLPAILFTLILPIKMHFESEKNFYSNLFVNSKKSFALLLPFFLGAGIFTCLFLVSKTGCNLNPQNTLELHLQRIFWLSPQIIFHYFMLIIYPVKLTIDQSLNVKIAYSLFDPYAISCIGIFFTIFLLSFFILIRSKKDYPLFFIIIIPFLFSLLPFSQIFAPSYNLASERYLYFPTWILTIGISNLLSITKKDKTKKIAIVLLTLLTISYSGRSHIRKLDWKNNSTLSLSAINSTENPLFKGQRFKDIIDPKYLLEDTPHHKTELKYKELAIKDFKDSIFLYKKLSEKYQSNIPAILINYGIDPKTYYLKSGISFVQEDFSIYNDVKRSLKLISPFVQEINLLDEPSKTFYASLLFFNGFHEEALNVLKNAYKINPYSTRIVQTYSDAVYYKYKNINHIEPLITELFKLYPYDKSVESYLIEIYRQKNDLNNFAKLTFIYGLRNHSLFHLKASLEAYKILNNTKMTEKLNRKISGYKN